MTLKIYQIDAFTNSLFGGNPAAVVPLTEWLDDETLQKIALENNLSETAFFIKKENHYHIRWMTPTSEVDLCGHATLAASFVIFNVLKSEKDKICLQSKSGELIVTRTGEKISLNFPSNKPSPSSAPKGLIEALKKEPIEILRNKAYLAVYEKEEDIKNFNPDFNLLKNTVGESIIVTAQGKTVDFVSRFFAPELGLDEDPVTGYAHTILTPFWSKRLKKNKLVAKQVSKRGGELWLTNLEERVQISGNAVLYSAGEIFI